ncbi:MAG: CPBP family intramembrane glutamic endopeptidase [Ferruginibacter sp.]
MKPIFKYLKLYYDNSFKWTYFFIIVGILGCIIYLNYWHGLEKKYVAGGNTWLRDFMGYYLMYLLTFATAFFLQLLFFRNCSYFKSGWFWAILFLAPAFFSFRVNFSFHEFLIFNKWQGPQLNLYLNSINWVVRVFVVLIPVMIIWWMKDRNNQPFYGTKKPDNIKPYLVMLLIMLPLISIASTQNDFLKMYPKAQVLSGLPSQTIRDKAKYVIYELCYGFDFVSIEFFFRGFLILSLARICGPQCIMPVACFYCTIHLGKPMGEAISSFFGGMILGIVSYNTRSIWGGLMVHLGIAWMMELGGCIGHLLKN